MAVKSFLRSSAFAALAASISFLAVPASALAAPEDGPSDRPSWSRGGGHQRGNDGEQGERRGRGERRADPQVQAPPAATVRAESVPREDRGNWSRGERAPGWEGRAPSAPPPVAQSDDRRGQWQGRGGERHDRGGNWQGRGGEWRGNPAPQQPRETRRIEPQQRDSWRGDNNLRERNGSYVDPNRSRSGHSDWRSTYRGHDGWRSGQDYRRWNRDWRQDNRYNWS